MRYQTCSIHPRISEDTYLCTGMPPRCASHGFPNICTSRIVSGGDKNFHRGPLRTSTVICWVRFAKAQQFVQQQIYGTVATPEDLRSTAASSEVDMNMKTMAANTPVGDRWHTGQIWHVGQVEHRRSCGNTKTFSYIGQVEHRRSCGNTKTFSHERGEQVP